MGDGPTEGAVDTGKPVTGDTQVQHLVAQLFRRSAGALVATLTRRFGIEALPMAEDVVQEAMLEAMRRWPFEGIPREPVAWLQIVARRKALDLLRRATTHERAIQEVSTREDVAEESESDGRGAPDMWLAAPFPLDDDVLGMLFACCTPSLGRETAVALTLSVVAGFSAREVAQAFLVSEAAMAQRLVRAKRRLRECGTPVAIPTEPHELAVRLPQVLGVVYLMFNEGYMASEGDALMREQLCGEATRLAVLLAEHRLTSTPEAHALAALLLFQLARLAARSGAGGAPVLMDVQDRAAWDPSLIAAGFQHLERAGRGDRVSSIHLQAEIASWHVVAERFESTNWTAILSAYDALLALEPTVVVQVNRAVAVGHVHGATAALAALEEAGRDRSSEGFRWFYAVRAHYRQAVGDTEGAGGDLRRATALTRTSPTLRWLEERHAALLDSSA